MNLARNGSTTYHGLPTDSEPVDSRPAPDTTANVNAALAGSPKLLLVGYPTNDTAKGYAVDETVRNLLAIRSHALSRDTAVIILSTQPRNLSSTQLDQLAEIDALMYEAAKPCFVQVRESLAGIDRMLAPQYDFGDGIHPNDAGHAVIRDKVIELIDAGTCVNASPS